MSSLTLHYDPTQSASMLVAASLKYLGVEFEAKLISVESGDHQSEEFLQVSPDGKVPVLQDGDFTVSGTATVIRYVIQEKGISHNFYPTDDLQERSTINSFVDQEQMGFRLPIILLIKGMQANPSKYTKDGFREDDVQTQYDKVSESFDKLTEILDRKEGPFVMGPNATLADLAYFFSTHEVTTVANASLDKHPEVKTWFDKVSQLEGVEEVLKAHRSSINE